MKIFCLIFLLLASTLVSNCGAEKFGKTLERLAEEENEENTEEELTE